MRQKYILFFVYVLAFFFLAIRICIGASSVKIVVVSDSSQSNIEKNVSEIQKILIDLRAEGRLKNISGLDTGFKRLDYNIKSERLTCERLGLGRDSLPVIAVVLLNTQGGPVKLLWKTRIVEVNVSIAELMTYFGITDYVAERPIPNMLKIAIKEDHYDSIIADCTNAIAANPVDRSAYLNRGKAYFYEKSFGLAIDDFTKIISINPNDGDAYYGRGRAYYYRGAEYRIREDLKKSIEDFTKAISINPNHALAYNDRGNSSLLLLDLTNIRSGSMIYYKPLEDFTKAIEIDQNFAPAYFNRGLCHLRDSSGYFYADKFSDINLAIQDFTKAISINPNDIDTAKYNWDNAFTKEDYEGMIVKSYYHRGTIYYHRGTTIYRDSKDIRNAVADLRKFIEIAPSDYEEAIGNAKQIIEEIENYYYK